MCFIHTCLVPEAEVFVWTHAGNNKPPFYSLCFAVCLFSLIWFIPGICLKKTEYSWEACFNVANIEAMKTTQFELLRLL